MIEEEESKIPARIDIPFPVQLNTKSWSESLYAYEIA